MLYSDMKIWEIETRRTAGLGNCSRTADGLLYFKYTRIFENSGALCIVVQGLEVGARFRRAEQERGNGKAKKQRKTDGSMRGRRKDR